MDFKERETVFKSAVADYTGGRCKQAAVKLRNLIEDGSNDPRHLSMLGIVTAKQDGNVREGLQLCERAVDLGFTDPWVHLNLARLNLSIGRRTRAVEVLRRGLRAQPGHPGMLREIQRLSPRGKPPIGFLDRDHALNRYLGTTFRRHQPSPVRKKSA
ncbi:MAG: hypothetical protein GTN89_12465 [Acidobacteria bacterium]|nr:hypothetical protein [Acidobacteriota bacterium]NIM63426.1 hypothetical protein [Acidobacteriota bacterium]NIO58357.1 hypothetical protein [Acidobacteriota bacterium]NIQ31156.1 hypothetical protein [Acidobacteriota bacterium]NIQ84028.1 hypothetical protein [Acidobacteriota bacterium]